MFAKFFATYENIDGGPLAQPRKVGKLSASCLSAFPGSVHFLQPHCPPHPNSFFPSLSYIHSSQSLHPHAKLAQVTSSDISKNPKCYVHHVGLTLFIYASIFMARLKTF